MAGSDKKKIRIGQNKIIDKAKKVDLLNALDSLNIKIDQKIDKIKKNMTFRKVTQYNIIVFITLKSSVKNNVFINQ